MMANGKNIRWSYCYFLKIHHKLLTISNMEALLINKPIYCQTLALIQDYPWLDVVIALVSDGASH